MTLSPQPGDAAYYAQTAKNRSPPDWLTVPGRWLSTIERKLQGYIRFDTSIRYFQFLVIISRQLPLMSLSLWPSRPFPVMFPHILARVSSGGAFLKTSASYLSTIFSKITLSLLSIQLGQTLERQHFRYIHWLLSRGQYHILVWYGEVMIVFEYCPSQL